MNISTIIPFSIQYFLYLVGLLFLSQIAIKNFIRSPKLYCPSWSILILSTYFHTLYVSTQDRDVYHPNVTCPLYPHLWYHIVDPFSSTFFAFNINWQVYPKCCSQRTNSNKIQLTFCPQALWSNIWCYIGIWIKRKALNSCPSALLWMTR